MASIQSRRTAIIILLSFEASLIVLYSVFVRYDKSVDPLESGANATTLLDVRYPMFQDIHVMVFVGFGFLMTFLRKYAYSAVGFTFFLSSLVTQWGLLCCGFFRLTSLDSHIHLNIESLMVADVVAAAFLISLGAVLGKLSVVQLIIMAIFEPVFFALNEFLGTEIFKAADAGGSMYVHVFGAYFGLAVSCVLPRGISAQDNTNALESSTYQSDINSLIGTLFLWMFWPSFNAGLLSGEEKHLAVLNTYLSLTASCLTAFATSSICNKNTKFDMVHVQNATLAGGVCIGTAANMLIQPYGVLLIGCFAGMLSVVGFRYIQKVLLKYVRMHDTCGVNNLHGMPGLAAGFIGATAASLADANKYGKRLYTLFPALTPEYGRTASQQAGYQLLALLTSFLVSIVGGLITGLSIRNFERIEKNFDDDLFWNLPDAEAKDKENLSPQKKH